MKLEISYKNSLIGSLSAGESLALHLNGSKLTEDLVVRAVGEVEETPTLISFTIAGIAYQAEQGMTWGEWVANTNYNTDGYREIGGDTYGIASPNGYIVGTAISVPVYTYEEIIAGTSYIVWSGGGVG